jgi:hypothetical protein
MGAKPELVYRTTIQPDALPRPKVATPPDPDAPLHAAIAEFVCTREQNLKKQLQSEDGLIRDRLALLQRELAIEQDALRRRSEIFRELLKHVLSEWAELYLLPRVLPGEAVRTSAKYRRSAAKVPPPLAPLSCFVLL